MSAPLTTTQLLKYALLAGHRRFQLLLLLGLVVSILSAPFAAKMLEIMQEAILAMPSDPSTSDDGQSANAMQILGDGMPTLVFCMFVTLLINIVGFIPWTRAVAHPPLSPIDGGVGAFIRRYAHSVQRMLAGVFAYIFVLGLGLLVLTIFNLALPAFGIIMTALVLLFLLTFYFFVQTAVGLAINSESCDRHEHIRIAWMRCTMFARPAVGCLVMLTLLSFITAELFISLYLGITGAATVPALLPIPILIQGVFSFMAAALHLAALHYVPNPVKDLQAMLEKDQDEKSDKE